ncbi:MAG: hypothetical protein A2986_01860 [Candidatus Jacksonbacteria bacterium RIFCSPLOWO2_01_FULL_44_13]|nr:MAG: hypothetical protein A2986_01860 [Candidatus Jacksonbacteria bacterium RIFCSPLOWO2_01_FULL_44_13]
MNELLRQALGIVPKVSRISAEVLVSHIDRDDEVRAAWLALVSGRPAFFLGSPGVDKTGTVQAIASRIAGAVFYDELMPTVVSVEQLLVESTSIEEVPLPNGGKAIQTRDRLGKAANAHLVFADEIWKSEPRVLNILLDLARGGEVRHEGRVVKTPLLAFLAASNELPDPEGNLGALWSRMTIRLVTQPLNRAGKERLVKARLARARQTTVGAPSQPAQLLLAEIETLRTARGWVEIPQNIVNIVLDIYQELADESSADFAWLWSDDRRFGRVFDILQAHALLEGRTRVEKTDLAVMEWLCWDTPDQIPTVRAKILPYCRTPLMDAQEAMDALLAPGGTVELVRVGDRGKGVQAIQQCEAALTEMKNLQNSATDTAMSAKIGELIQQLESVKQDVVAVVTGTRRL